MANSLDFTGGDTFDFLTALTSEGFPLATARKVEEALEANGVNGRRHRKINDAYPVFELRTLAQAEDFDDAIALAESYLVAVRDGADATLTINGVDMTGMHVSAVRPIPFPGAPIHPDTDPDTPPTAHVVAVWQIEFTAP
jgi:hypothetical protein